MLKIIRTIGMVGVFSFFALSNIQAQEINSANYVQAQIIEDDGYHNLTSFSKNYQPFMYSASDMPTHLEQLSITNENPNLKTKGFFSSAINASQNFINKGINFIKPPKVEVAEETFIQKYTRVTTTLISQGSEYIGVPYLWGGNSEKNGFDCSGLVVAVFNNSIGINLPRTAKEMSSVGEKIASFNNLKPGDLVFFNTMRRAFSHVGIYIGDNKFLHAPRKGAKVRVETLDKSYWTKRFNGARRVLVESDIDEIFDKIKANKPNI